MKGGGHPSLDQLRAFDLGQLHALERLEVEGHVAGCDTCCRKLEALPSDGLVALLRVSAGTPGPDTHAPAAASVPTPSEPGTASRTEVPAELADHPRYRVLGFIGAGGMGAVFKAEHRLMERVVALKVLNRTLTDRPAAVERFRLEARAAARLAHPNIVTAHDAEQAGEVHFLITEFVEGMGLDRWVEDKGPLPVAQACDFARQVALGLQHAHERGMVHRDVKPGNLLVTPAGQVKVLDFGLARFVSESGGGKLTQAGAVVGTPDYMAPEQALDPQRADVRADLYGLGCTLYHLLAGRPPFPEPTVLQKLMAHQEQTAPRLTERRGDVPEALAAVVERLLAKDPARRYQTPVEVAAVLEPFAQGSPPAPPSNWQEPRGNRPGRSRFGKAALAAALLLSLGGLLAVVLHVRTDRGRTVLDESHSAPPATTPQQPARPARDELRCFGGGVGRFSAVAFAADGRQALTAGPDHALALWDLDAGKVVARLTGHTDTVLCLAFSADGRQALSGGEDRTVCVWDLARRRRTATLRRHVKAVLGVAFTWDGRHAFSAGDDGRLVLWDVPAMRHQAEFPDNPYAVNGVVLDGKNVRAATPCSDGKLRLWRVDPKIWRQEAPCEGHAGPVTCAAWSGDARFLLSGGADHTLRLWRERTHREVALFTGHTAEVRCLALGHDLRRALSGGDDDTVRLWELAGAREAARFTGHRGGILAVAFTPDGRRAFSGGRDGTLREWQLPEPADDRPTRYSEMSHPAALRPDGKMLVTAFGTERVTVMDVTLRRLPGETAARPRLQHHTFLAGHTATVLALAFTPDSRTLASGAWDGTVRLWDVATGKQQHMFTGHVGAVRSVAFSADGKTLATAGGDGTVRLWDVTAGRARRVIETGQGPVQCVALADDGRTLASAGADGTVKLWDAATGELRDTLHGHAGPAHAVAFTPDGGTVISGGQDRTVRLWSATTGRERRVLRGHTGPVLAVAVGADGRTLASASSDRTVQLWDAATGRKGRTLVGARGAVCSLSFRADGRLLASATLAGQMTLHAVTSALKPVK